MVKKSSKIIIFSIVLITIIIGILSISIFLNSKTTYYNDANLGIVKITISSGWLKNLNIFSTKQAYFSSTQITLGKSVTATENFGIILDCSKARAETAKMYIDKDGSTVSTIDLIYKIGSSGYRCGSNLQVSVTYTPAQIGQYKARTVVGVIPYNNGWYCSGDWAKNSDTGNSYGCSTHKNLVQNGITLCTSSGTCALSSSVQSITLSSANTLVVSPVSSPCTKRGYFGSWELYKNIDGGQIQTRAVYEVTNDCNYKISYYEDQTICNDGFTIDDDGLNKIATGDHNCIEKQITIPDEEIPEPDCNADISIQCDDGSSVVTQACLDGFLVDTGHNCLIIPDGECINPIYQNCQDGTKVIIKDCIDGNYILKENVCNDGTPDEEDIPTKPSLVPYIVIISSIIIVFLIFFIILRRRK